MAVNKRGKTLPTGIRQRSKDYEGRVYYEYKEYVVHAATITETQKKMRELKYKLDLAVLEGSTYKGCPAELLGI